MRTAVAAFLLVLAGTSPARAVERPVSPVAALTPVTALAGHVVWSQYDATTRTYRLVDSLRGAVAVPLPVAPRAVPFDADLGRGFANHLWLTYSRCAREPTRRDLLGRPVWSTARGCRLYVYDYGLGRERHIPRIDVAGASDYLPSAWRGHVAFVRLARAGTTPRVEYLANRAFSPTAPLRRLPGGSTYRCCGARGYEATQLDLVGHHLAFTWDFAEQINGFHAWELNLDSTAGRRTLVDIGAGGEQCAHQPLFPTLASGGLAVVYVVRRNCGPSSLALYQLRHGTRYRAAAPELPEAFTTDGGLGYWGVDVAQPPAGFAGDYTVLPDCATDGCAVTQLDPPDWHPIHGHRARPLVPFT